MTPEQTRDKTPDTNLILSVQNISKQFTLHVQNGVSFSVIDDLSFTMHAGQCIALSGPSGVGKSTIMQMIYGSYLCEQGSIEINHRGKMSQIAGGTPQLILDIRRHTIGYVSQFLRVIPRIPTSQIIAEPLLAKNVDEKTAASKTCELLERLLIPEKLWSLSPLTFSGGEQQRVNIARCFIADYPLILLDEPTASLDDNTRNIVLELINEANSNGSAVLGIFHENEVKHQLKSTLSNLTELNCHESAISA